MGKEEIKRCVLIGIVAGITAAITMMGSVYAFIYIYDAYKEYRNESAIKAGASSHCERPGLQDINSDKRTNFE